MKNKLFLFILVLLLITAFCGKKNDTKGIDLKMKIVPTVLTDDLYAKMDYSFDFKDDFKKLDKKYKIFVHFLRVKSKEMLFQDDHYPSILPESWEKGKTIEYSREIYIPKFLDEYDIDFEGYEKLKISVGLYDPENPNDKINLFQKVFNVQSASINAPEIIYDEGWHQPETNFKSDKISAIEWRWTSKKAVCIVENPKKDSILKIKGNVAKENLKDQKIRFLINDVLLDEFVPESNTFEKKYVIPANKMGSEDEFRFIIEADKTFTPSKLDPKSKDDRVLGIQIFSIYFRENFVD